MNSLNDGSAPLKKTGRLGRAWKTIEAWPTWVKVLAGVAVFVAIAGIGSAIEGPEESDQSNSSAGDATVASTTTAETPAKSLTPLERKEAAYRTRRAEATAFHESIAEAIDSDDTPSVRCEGQHYCGVTYEVEELQGFDSAEELVFDQTEVWDAMFANPKFRGGFIELEGPVESVGGKVSVAPLLRVRCDRAAANEIDWENVDADGLKQLCAWQELVDL